MLNAARSPDPARADVQALLGAVYDQKLNDPAAAADAFGNAARLDAANPVRAYALARHLARQGKPHEAMDALRGVVGSSDRDAARQARGPASAPFICFDLVPESRDVEPFFPPVRYQGGFAALRQGDFEAAVARFEMAASGDPLVPSALRGPGGGGAGADRDATGRAAQALRDGAVDTAIEQLTAARRAAPGSAELRRLPGRAFALDGRIDAAIDVLTCTSARGTR